MPEDMARVLGADGPTTVEIAGKQCTARPLSMQELTEAQRDCLKQYRRSYLETFADNRDLIPNYEAVIQQKVDEAAKWDIDDLPTRHAYDPAKVKINKALRRWLENNFDAKGKAEDQLKVLAAAALDQELLTEDQYKEMTGAKSTKVRVGYVNWWITGCYDGMISVVWNCFKHNGVTREEVAAEMIKNPTMMTELSREIETLSVPAVENG